ncbi:MAG: ribbon-helix-helix protein, CopG family [Terrimicrobiaceae bacterium]
MSATVDSELLEELESFRREERRSRSQVIEMALEKFLTEHRKRASKIVTSDAVFEGRFTREDCYDR